MKQNWKPLLVVAFIALATYYLLPSFEFYGLSSEEKTAMEQTAPNRLDELHKNSLNLGLDLQGGIHLVLEVDLSELPEDQAIDAVARAKEIIRNRVDQFGVAEPTIQLQGDTRIIVELPGVQDVERAKDLVGQTALLEFQLLEPDIEKRNQYLTRINNVISGKSDTTAADTAAADTEEAGLFDETPTPQEDETTGLSLFSLLVTRGDNLVIPARALPRVKAILNDPRAQAVIPDDLEFLYSSKPEGDEENLYYTLYLVQKEAEMTGEVLQNATVSTSQDMANFGLPEVDFVTTDEGTKRFARVTGAHIGERLAIVLDGAVYSAPNINTKISEGSGRITGSFDQAEAQDLAIVLRAGTLPAPIEIIEDRTVGPALGRDSIEQGRIAAIISMVLIALFMLAYYRVAGIIADIALALNILFVFSILAAFHATLTLPGIAGIILTIGMAVDANVLIFERIRDELRHGKTIRAAIDSGYSNAFSAIIDANLTTLLVGIVLYQFGTGPIRGFALTLCIGILSSLFTAFFVTRVVFNLITRRSEVDNVSIGPVHFFGDLAIAFLQRRKTAFIISGAVLALGLVSMVAINGINKGIDFAGGTLLEVHFDPPVPVEDIRSSLNQVSVGDKVVNLSSSEIKEFGPANDILIRVAQNAIGTDLGDGIKNALKNGFPGSIQEKSEWIRREEKVGPKIGEELSGAALRAVLIALALILVYMAIRFHRVLYGIAAVIALFHDVLITLGLLSIFNIEITLAVVAALLAIVGYSLNDTIVVFDRIRENLNMSRRQGFGAIIDISINECLSRTLITSLTTVMAVLVLMIWGGEVIRDFTITLMIGVLVGTYSSIFIASPALFIGHQRTEEKEKKA